MTHNNKYSDYNSDEDEETSLEEGFCPVREDKTHCECWWDGDSPCCSCGFDGPGEKENDD